MVRSEISSPGKLRLMIVEDDTLLALDMKDMVEELGHEVVCVASRVEEALAAFEADRPQAVLLDANLHGYDAGPLVRQLRREAIPFVLSTGYDVSQLREAGITEPVLPKPFNLRQLDEALAGVASAIRKAGSTPS